VELCALAEELYDEESPPTAESKRRTAGSSDPRRQRCRRGATQEAEDDASVVEVTATDDEFTYEPPKESVARRSFSPTKARRRTSC
jgi:hypothetical protein